MGFCGKTRPGCALIFLFLANAVMARSTDRRQITVMVNDRVQAPRGMLVEAEVETARIFRAAGVDIKWTNCGLGVRACLVASDPAQFVVAITPSRRMPSSSVFGEAFFGEDGSGKYCDVYLDRIQQAEKEWGVNSARLLGAVVAHELGHLLLGPHAHSHWGIMSPLWEGDNVTRVNMGTALFTGQQSALMKRRLNGMGPRF